MSHPPAQQGSQLSFIFISRSLVIACALSVSIHRTLSRAVSLTAALSLIMIGAIHSHELLNLHSPASVLRLRDLGPGGFIRQAMVLVRANAFQILIASKVAHPVYALFC